MSDPFFDDGSDSWYENTRKKKQKKLGPKVARGRGVAEKTAAKAKARKKAAKAPKKLGPTIAKKKKAPAKKKSIASTKGTPRSIASASKNVGAPIPMNRVAHKAAGVKKAVRANSNFNKMVGNKVGKRKTRRGTRNR